MSIARQYGMVSGKAPKKEEAPVKPSIEFIPKENVDNGTWEPSVKVELTGEQKQWGVRIDKAVFDLVKRNSSKQSEDAEKMILMYASKMGWK